MREEDVDVDFVFFLLHFLASAGWYSVRRVVSQHGWGFDTLKSVKLNEAVFKKEANEESQLRMANS